MISRLSVRFTRRAARHVDEAGRWWHANRTKAPGARREELARALQVITTQPEAGATARNVRLAGRCHIAGPSNGGIAAFHVAALHPRYFSSVTAFPGYMWQPRQAKLEAISKMCVFMYVGEFDEYMWHDEMNREAEFLRSRGGVARYTVEQGQPRRIDTLAGPRARRLFDGFDHARKGCV